MVKKTHALTKKKKKERVCVLGDCSSNPVSAVSHLGNSPLPVVPWATGLGVDPEVPGAVPGANESSDWSHGRSLPLRRGWDPDCPAAGRRRPGGSRPWSGSRAAPRPR